jgi:hypothetical protein
MAIAHDDLGPLSRDFFQVTELLAAFLQTCKQFLHLDKEVPEVRKTHEQLLVDGVLFLRFGKPGFESLLSCSAPVIGTAFHFADLPPQDICRAL